MKCYMNPYPKRLYKVMKFGSYWKTLVSETKIWEKMLITIHMTFAMNYDVYKFCSQCSQCLLHTKKDRDVKVLSHFWKVWWIN